MQPGILHIAVIIKMNTNAGMTLNAGDGLNVEYLSHLCAPLLFQRTKMSMRSRKAEQRLSIRN